MKRLKYRAFSKSERDFWKNMEVNIDSFCNSWGDRYEEDFIGKLETFSPRFIRQIIDHFGIKVPAGNVNLIDILCAETRHAIETYCVIVFAYRNPKVLSGMYRVPIIKKKVNRAKVTEHVFKAYQDGLLTDLFLYLLKQQAGKGRHQYSFAKELDATAYTDIINFMPNLTAFLRKRDKRSKKYHFRFGYKGRKGEWIFLLLKESEDRVYRAIPHNISMVSGTYKLITVNPATQTIEIHTNSRPEAQLIRNYFNQKLGNHYTFKRDEKAYQPKKFFDKVLQIKPNDNLRLIDAKFKKSNIGPKIHLEDPQRKNDLIESLKMLRDTKILKLEDFSEFEKLIFSYNGLEVTVQIFETLWGTHKLNLVNKRIPQKDLLAFKNDFQKTLGVPLDVWLKRSDEKLNKSHLIAKLILLKTVRVNTISEDVEDTLLQLMADKIIDKPQHETKRVCEVCFHKTWEKGNGSCPACGNDMRIEGDFVDIRPHQKGIYNYVIKAFQSIPDLKVSRDEVQILRVKHQFIELMDKKGDSLSVYIAPGPVPEEIVSHFHNNGLPLLVILTKYQDALAQALINKNFECLGLSELYTRVSEKKWLDKTIPGFIQAQKMKWKQKLLDKGYQSFQTLAKKGNDYSAHKFETDIFNLFHEIFYVAFKLGGTFTGVAAPDGIVSIQNQSKPLQKFCMSWDCKYSRIKKGYQLNEKPEKHRHYINVLTKNSRVKFYGSLKIHAFISQNMAMNKYETFYKKLVNRMRWKGAVLFIDEKIILELYRFYRENSTKIAPHPMLFYTSLHRMFAKIHKRDSTPFPVLTETRLDSLINEVKNKYAKRNIPLKFDRKDFAK